MATIPDAGLVAIATALARSAYWYIELGTSSTAEGTSQTALVAAITTNNMTRTVATAAYEATAKCTLQATIGPASGAFTNIRETGVFDNASNGNMAVRHVWAADRAVAVGDSMQITHKITASR
jgi:hypothetical protein